MFCGEGLTPPRILPLKHSIQSAASQRGRVAWRNLIPLIHPFPYLREMQWAVLACH